MITHINRFERVLPTELVTRKTTYADLVSSFSDIAPLKDYGIDSGGITVKGFELGSSNKPTIIIFNAHASEWMAVNYIILFARRLKNGNFINRNQARKLLLNFRWIFIPTISAWAYENQSYKNFNGVNINRNWDNNWESSGARSDDPSNSNYGGTAPESEPETQIIANLVRQLKPIAMYDCHTNGSGTGGGIDIARNMLYNIPYLEVSKQLSCIGHHQQDWNTSWHPTSIGFGIRQNSNHLPKVMATIIEASTETGISQLETEQYGINALYQLSLLALDYYRARIKKT